MDFYIILGHTGTMEEKKGSIIRTFCGHSIETQNFHFEKAKAEKLLGRDLYSRIVFLMHSIGGLHYVQTTKGFF